MPNIQLATVALLIEPVEVDLGITYKTLAQRRWGEFQGRAPAWPLGTVEHDGSRATADFHVEEARLVITVEGRSEAEAREVAYQVKDVFLPPEKQTDGLHTEIEYFDPVAQENRVCHFSGAVLESGPRAAPDGPNRIIVTFLVHYW